MLSFFPRGVLDEILNLIESDSEDFPSYSWNIFEQCVIVSYDKESASLFIIALILSLMLPLVVHFSSPES